MKTFADAKFSVTTHPAGIAGKIHLDNGMRISIVMNERSYGHSKGLWEIAVFGDDGQVNLDCLEHDVLGHLDFHSLENKIREIQEEIISKAL